MSDSFAAEYGPVMRVSLAWGVLYYFAVFFQGQVNTGKFIPGNKAYLHFVARTLGNLLEQTPIALISMWIYAASVDVGDAASLGGFWMLLRIGWVVIWGCAGTDGSPPPSMAAATMPQYITISYMLWTPCLWHGLLGFELKMKELCGGYLALAVPAQGMPCMFISFGAAFAMNKVFQPIFDKQASALIQEGTGMSS